MEISGRIVPGLDTTPGPANPSLNGARRGKFGAPSLHQTFEEALASHQRQLADPAPGATDALLVRDAPRPVGAQPAERSTTGADNAIQTPSTTLPLPSAVAFTPDQPTVLPPPDPENPPPGSGPVDGKQAADPAGALPLPVSLPPGKAIEFAASRLPDGRPGDGIHFPVMAYRIVDQDPATRVKTAFGPWIACNTVINKVGGDTFGTLFVENMSPSERAAVTQAASGNPPPTFPEAAYAAADSTSLDPKTLPAGTPAPLSTTVG